MIKGQDLWNSSVINNMADRAINGRTLFTYLDMPKNCYQLLQNSSQKFPNKKAFFDNWGHQYSYVEFKQQVDKLASYLATQLNIQPKMNIGLLLYNSVEFCVAFYAIAKLGAIAIPFPSKYRESELTPLIQRSDLDLLIINEDFQLYFLQLTKSFKIIISMDEQHGFGFRHYLDSYSTNDYINIDYQPDLADIAVIMFTSGTTSQSKGVVLRNYNLIHAALTYQRTLNLNADDKTIIPIPIYHITGLSALLNLFVYLGGTIYLYRYYDAKNILDCIVQNQITFMHGSPTVFSKLLDYKAQYPKLNSLKMIGCGSSYTPLSKLKLFHRWLPYTKFIVIYGMTETASPALLFPDDTATHIYANASGIPIPGLEVKIMDDQGQELAVDQVGDIWLKGSVICEQYYNLNTPLINDEHWLNTGDLGYINQDHYVFVIDRKKDMINRGGEKIYCRDVENEILLIDGINDCAVVAVDDEVYGEVAAAMIVVEKTFNLSPLDIQLQLKKRLATYKIPAYFLTINEIPKTPALKVDKKLIRQHFHDYLSHKPILGNQLNIDEA